MARIIGAPLRSLIAGDHARHIKLEIQDSDGTWRDFASLGGNDYLDGLTISISLDSATKSGTATLRRDVDNPSLSLSPLMGSSLINRNAVAAYVALVKPARPIRAWMGFTAVGASPVAGDWWLVLDGKVDRVKFDTDPMEVSFRDKGAWLLAKEIEGVEVYGSVAGVAVETTLQQILNTNPPKGGAPTLVVPVSPAWVVGEYRPEGNVMEASRAVALGIGWDYRYMYASQTTEQLRFFSPDRAKTVPDFTFGPDEYFAVEEVETNDDDIRNRVRVKFVDTSNVAQSVLRTNAASEAEHGPRFMEITKDKTSMIRTTAQANALGDAALGDLASEPVTHAVRTSLFPFAELGDLLGHLADNERYDSQQNYAVVGIEHSFRASSERGGDEVAETRFLTRGKPAAAYKRWLDELGSEGIDSDLAANSLLDVLATEFATTYSIAWGGTGVISLQIDGGAWQTPPPASPIVVTRNPENGATKIYRFRTVLGEDITYESIYVMPIGAISPPPNLTVTPANPLVASQSYTVTATNPRSGGPLPVLEVFAVGVSGTATKPDTTVVAITDGASPIIVPTGTVVLMTRPLFGDEAGNVIFRATLAGGSIAEIQRTVTPRQSIGPNLNVVPTAYASTYSIVWSGTGVLLSIDGGAFAAPPASPIIVNRPAIGSPDKVYTFSGTLDGQTITNTLTIPAIGSPETPNLTVTVTAQSDTTQTFLVTAASPLSGVTPTNELWLTDCTSSTFPGTYTGIASGVSVVINRPAFGLKKPGVLRVRSSIGTSFEEIVHQIDPQVQTSFGPSLTVTPIAYATTYSIYFSGDGVQVDKSDGFGYVAAGASPHIVTRPAVGSPDLIYSYRATKDGQEVTNSITIPAIGAAEPPNLNVAPAAATATQQSFTVTFTPVSGTSCAVYVVGCTLASAHYSGGPVASGDVVTVNKPAFGEEAGSVRFVATRGTASEKVARTIVTQKKISFGPTLDLGAYFDADNYYITWNAPGAESVSYHINTGADNAIGTSGTLTVARNAAGGEDKLVTFKATKDGQTIPNSVTVPAKGRIGPTLDIGAYFDADNYYITWNAPGALAMSYHIDTGADNPIANSGTLTVARGAIGTNDKVVTFKALRDSQEITNSITVVAKGRTPPTLDVWFTVSPTQYLIYYTSDGYVEYSIDNGARIAASSPITATRNGPGGVPKLYTVFATTENRTLANSVTVDAQVEYFIVNARLSGCQDGTNTSFAAYWGLKGPALGASDYMSINVYRENGTFVTQLSYTTPQSGYASAIAYGVAAFAEYYCELTLYDFNMGIPIAWIRTPRLFTGSC